MVFWIKKNISPIRQNEKQDKDIRAKIQLAEQEKDSFGEAEESYGKLDREIYQVWNIIRSDKRNCDRID